MKQRSTTTGQYLTKRFAAQVENWRRQIRQAGAVTETTDACKAVVGTAKPALPSAEKSNG